MAPTSRIHAVLTGDIVGSTKLSSGQMAQARKTLTSCVSVFNLAHKEVVQGGPAFYRGDSWQLLLREPKLALRLAILVRARLAAKLDIKTRISIGMGLVTDTRERSVSLRTGEAFTLSGRALDNITGYFRLTGALPERFGAIAAWFPSILHLCDALMSSWTRRQAEVVATALQLRNPTHEAIAASLVPPVAKQSVTDILAGANWRAIAEPIMAFESADWQHLSVVSRDETGENAGHAPDRRKRLSQAKRRGVQP